jgi:hypothetical protein
MPEGEHYEPTPEEISDAGSRMTDEEREMTEKREFQPNPESFEMLALECEQVRILAEAYSQKAKEPVVVLCNGSAGTIYHIGIDSVSTQFNRQMEVRVERGQDRESFIHSQRDEFAKDWQRCLQETRESWPKDLPLTKSRKVALIKTAKEWMDAGRLDFLAIPEIDVRIDSMRTQPTAEGSKILDALSMVGDKFLYIYLDWSDWGGGYRGPGSFDIGNEILREYVSQSKQGVGWGKIFNHEGNLLRGHIDRHLIDSYYSSNREWLGIIMDGVKNVGRRMDLLVSPMHSPGTREEERDEKRMKNWQSRIEWLTDWPAGIDYDRASKVKGKEYNHTDVDPEGRLNLFSEESDDTETRIRKYNQVMRDAVHSIRELQVEENGDNYFQRQKRYKL